MEVNIDYQGKREKEIYWYLSNRRFHPKWSSTLNDKKFAGKVQ